MYGNGTFIGMAKARKLMACSCLAAEIGGDDVCQVELIATHTLRKTNTY